MFSKYRKFINGSDDTSLDTLIYLQKRDVTFLNEYNNYGSATLHQDIPKYYAMFGGATGITDTTSGTIMFEWCKDLFDMFFSQPF